MDEKVGVVARVLAYEKDMQRVTLI